MKIIQYNLCTRVNRGTEENPRFEEYLSPVTLDWSEANEAIAKIEAYHGEYTIEDDGIEPTAEEQIVALKAQLAATDYTVIKIAEGAATAEEYADVIARRQAWRAEINKLEMQ